MSIYKEVYSLVCGTAPAALAKFTRDRTSLPEDLKRGGNCGCSDNSCEAKGTCEYLPLYNRPNTSISSQQASAHGTTNKERRISTTLLMDRSPVMIGLEPSW